MLTVSFYCIVAELRCLDQVMKSESGTVQKTFPSHSKAVMSLVSGARYTVTTGEDFEVHVYQTSVLMKASEGSVDIVALF